MHAQRHPQLLDLFSLARIISMGTVFHPQRHPNFFFGCELRAKSQEVRLDAIALEL
jgi:hypothetical protein